MSKTYSDLICKNLICLINALFDKGKLKMKNTNCILILNLINFFIKWKNNYEGIDFHIGIVTYFLHYIYAKAFKKMYIR